jgi:hypothetical protein
VTDGCNSVTDGGHRLFFVLQKECQIVSDPYIFDNFLRIVDT